MSEATTTTTDKSNPVKNTEIVPQHIQRKTEFQLYVVWKTLPHYFKRPPMKRTGRNTFEDQTSDEFLDSLGVDDELIIELSRLKTQGQFAEKYDLAQETLSDWNKEIVKRDILGDVRNWALRLSKNVLLAMYNNALSNRNLNADRDRLNFLKFCGYVEKNGVALSADETLTDVIKRSLIKPKNGAGATGEN